MLRAIAGARYVLSAVAKQGRRSNVEHRSYEWAVRGLATLAVALLYALFLSPSGIPKLQDLETVLEERSDAVVERIRINRELETSLATLRTDKRALEEVARKARFARPDELILVLPTPEN